MLTLSRRLTATACAVALLVPAAPAVAVDAPEEAPTELWEEYPLREERGAPGDGAGGASERPRAAEDDDARPSPAPRDEDGGLPVAAIAGGGAALALLGGAALLAGRRRRPARAAGGSAGAPVREATRATRAAPRTPARAAPAAAPEAGPTLVFGYLRATPEDALLDEAARVREAAARRGLTLRHIVWDRPDEPGRPWLSWVVGRIAAGEATGVVLARLDDLGPTPAERETVLDRLTALGATVVVVGEHDVHADRLAPRAAASGPVQREITT